MSFLVNTKTPSYKITAIVSLYKAERFLRACLEDLIAQTIFAQTEVIIIDANSPENEQSIALEFTQKYPNIKYLRTKEREGLYASWNRGLSIANGKYITNANADDRHAPHALERLTDELEKNPEIALVYANCKITNTANALFHSAPICGHMRWLAYDHINLLRRCEVGPQPVWRRSIHESIGMFDEKFTITGDYDMWLRISEYHPLRHIPEELGLYLSYDNNLETQNPQHTQNEYLEVQAKALQRFMSMQYKPQLPFDEQLSIHKLRLERYLCNLNNGNSIKNTNKLAYHVYAYILLQAKLNVTNDLTKLSKLLTLPSHVSADYLKALLKA